MQGSGLVELLARKEGTECGPVGSFGELDEVVLTALSGMLELLVALQAVNNIYEIQRTAGGGNAMQK